MLQARWRVLPPATRWLLLGQTGRAPHGALRSQAIRCGRWKVNTVGQAGPIETIETSADAPGGLKTPRPTRALLILNLLGFTTVTPVNYGFREDFPL